MVSDELPDSQLVQSPSKIRTSTPWIYLALIIALAALMLGSASFIFSRQQRMQKENPFLQVTNRQFSLFLWQFPEFMRVNVSQKAGYLPGFQYIDKIAIESGQADDYVSAPPDLIFFYHRWKELVADEFSPRAISAKEFLQFLDYLPEWLPENWKDRPEGYQETVRAIRAGGVVLDLPKEVQQAFIGWKNFFMEGDLINQVRPTFRQMGEFIKQAPHYARNYWRNLLIRGKPDYLKSLVLNANSDAVIPEDEMAAFLRVAFFNYTRKSLRP